MAYFNSGSYISASSYQTSHGKKLKLFWFIAVIAFVALIIYPIKVFVVRAKTNSNIRETYKKAVKIYETGREYYDIDLMDQAYEGFVLVQDYEDSQDYMDKINEEKSMMIEYESAMSYYESNDYENALIAFHSLGNYRDSENNIKDISDKLYSDGKGRMDNKEYDEARTILIMIPEYSGDIYDKAQELLASIDDKQQNDMLEQQFKAAIEKYNSEDYIGAQSDFINIRDYSNSEDYINQIGSHFYSVAQESYTNKDYSNCLDAINHIDTETEWKRYEEALSLKESFESDYKQYVEETSKQKLDEEGYSSFETFVNGCVNDLYSKNEADALLKDYKPIYLCDMKAFDMGVYDDDPTFPDKGTFIYDLYYEDNLYDEDGQVHQNCLSGGGSYLTYHLGGEYTTLSGTMFVLKDGQATIDRPVFLCVRDGNGTELYRESLYSGYGNKNISINVSGVEDITLIFSGAYNGLFSDYKYGAIGELCLMK